jgi:hypothetical protein
MKINEIINPDEEIYEKIITNCQEVLKILKLNGFKTRHPLIESQLIQVYWQVHILTIH